MARPATHPSPRGGQTGTLGQPGRSKPFAPALVSPAADFEGAPRQFHPASRRAPALADTPETSMGRVGFRLGDTSAPSCSVRLTR